MAGTILAGTCALLLLASSVGRERVLAQIPPSAVKAKDTPREDSRRVIIPVRNVSVGELMGPLEKMFEGQKGTMIIPQLTTNMLLVSAPPAVLEEIQQTVKALDQPPKQIVLEVWIVQMGLAADAKKPDSPKRVELRRSDLSGPREHVLETIRALQGRGQVTSFKRLQLTCLNNQQASVMQGEDKPVVTGSTRTRTGIGANMVTYRSVGTTVTASPRVTDGETIQVDLRVEESRLEAPSDGVALSTPDEGKPIIAPEVVSGSFKSTLQIPAGQAILAGGLETDAKATQSKSLLIVAAQVTSAKK